MKTTVLVTKLETIERSIEIEVEHEPHETPWLIKRRAEDLARRTPAEEFTLNGVVELEYIGEIL